MAKVIMIQGTMSGAGKSLLVTGLLRILKEDGIKAAPFKSQNMALNSFITKDGLEMGRAQAVQAEAAGIEPSVYMNPILLKPTDDIGSQVIVNGEVLGNMPAREYFAYKRHLIPDILNAYEYLAKKYDVIVIEGAGSPAEINLKENDIVNMGLAEMLQAPVLLAGDIDRGGVFAQLYGTVELLAQKERSYLKGMIINKFRGDETLLYPGIQMLEQKIGIPVIGTVPMMQTDIEEEDSLSERFEHRKIQGQIDIAVIRLPKISNYTDFAPLEILDQVSVRYVKSVKDLGHPDLILLPGSKSTMEDLEWLRTSGMESAILKEVQKDTLLFGICGGYQMLGEEISDPENMEGGGAVRGMGLLPVNTVFGGSKTRTRITGRLHLVSGVYKNLQGASFRGYEIHMGETRARQPVEILAEKDGRMLGCVKGIVGGTYIHGFFETASVADCFLSLLAEKKGLSEIKSRDYKAYKEEQYRIAAEGIRKGLQMDRIYEIIDKGVGYDGRI